VTSFGPLSAQRRRFAAALRSRAGILAAGALLAIIGGVLCFAATPLWWFGGALLSSALVLFARAFNPELRAVLSGRTVVPTRALAEISCLAVITAFATVMMADIVGGQRPVSRDHTIHYAKAWLLHSHLLPTGRLFGWTNQWFAGYPANYLYPPGADLWVNAVHALFFGANSFSQSYAIAFWLFHVFSGIAVYRLGRLVGGRAVGLLAALLCLTDLASFRMGGWQYTVEYGVWPQALSLDFGLMALCSLPALVETRKLAPLGAFGIWTGLAIITHPIYLIFLGLTALTAALAAGLADGVRAATAALRLFVACVLSLWVGALWLLPFLTSRSETNSMGVWWDTTFEMAKGLLDLKLFPGTLGYVFAFGIIGISVMLKARRFAPLFVALSALAIPIISNSTFIDELHLATLASAFSKIQYIRLSTMVKPFWFVLAAYVAVAVFTHARDLVLNGERTRSALSDSAARAAALAGVVGLLTIPVLVPTAQAFWTRNVRKTIMTEAERPLLADRIGLEHWLEHELPRDGFYRVGVFTGDNHDLMDLGSLIDRPLFKRGFTPASNFIYQMHDRDPAILEAINLRFAISKLFLPEQDFEQLATFGRYSVYRFKHWQPDPFQVLEGAGDVYLTSFHDEDITLLAAPGAHGKLRLNVSYFSRWHAYRDGRPIPISLTYLRESPDDTGFITVALEPGRYRFAFERTLADRLAIPLGCFGILLCAALILADRRRQVPVWSARVVSAVTDRLDALSGQAWRNRRLLLLCAAASVALVVLVRLAMRVPPLDLQELGALKVERVRFDFLERLANARANIQYGETRRNCIRQQDRLVCRDARGNLDLERYVASSPATLKDYILVRCIRARPVTDGVLNITYADVPIGSAIVGYYGIERAGRLMSKRRPVQMQIAVNGKSEYDGQTQNDNEMRWFKIPMQGLPGAHASVTFSVSADNVSRRYFCFNAQVVDLP
jgi:hypothetical protein